MRLTTIGSWGGGIDAPFLVHWEGRKRVVNVAKLVREWLSQLSTTGQQRIALENIERILADQPAPAQTCELLTQ